jgi:hypothetical protein
MPLSSLCEAALQYARRGWRVFPLEGKVPKIKEWQHRCSNDESQIKAWWNDYPNANVGLATGAVSGFFVVDIDGESGKLTLLDIEMKNSKLPPTYEVETGKGKHYYFEQEIGIRIKTQAGGSLGLNIDVRGDGGYVVAPPSKHPDSGKLYRVSRDVLPARPPDWLLSAVMIGKLDKATKDHQAPIEIKTGQRNAQITRIAGQLRWLGLTTEEIVRALLEVNIQRCRPPLEEREIISVAQSIGKKDPGLLSPTGSVSSEIVLQNYSTMEMKPILWRWPGFIPRGQLVIWAGDPGQGKSIVSCALAAAVTTGSRMPGDDGLEKYEPENVLIMSAEDDPETTIKPRLVVAGADLNRIQHVQMLCSDGKPLSLPTHLFQLTEKITETKAKLVIIDPLDAFLGEDVDSYKNADVRRAVAPITTLAYHTHAIILIIAHLNKNTTATKAMHRVSGSGAFVAAPRVSFVFGPSRENEQEHIFAPMKINIALAPKPLKYIIESVIVSNVGSVPKVKWIGSAENDTADSILLAAPANGNEDPETRGDAKKYLKDVLGREQPKRAREIFRESSDLCSKRTLMYAKAELHIKSERMDGEWWWALPDYKWQKELPLEDNNEV